MKFKDYQYLRPDIESYQKRITDLLDQIGADLQPDIELKAVQDFFDLNDELDSMATLVSIRNSLDTKDPFYQEEQDFFDENGPKLQMYSNLFSKKIIQSKNRPYLEEKLGKLIFKQAELQEKTFSEAIIPDLQKENKLSTKY